MTLSLLSSSDYKNTALLSIPKPLPAAVLSPKWDLEKNSALSLSYRTSFVKFTTLLVHLAQDSLYAAINIAIKGSVRLTSVKSIKRSLSLIMSLIYKRWLPLNEPMQHRLWWKLALTLSLLCRPLHLIVWLLISCVCLCSPLTVICLTNIKIQYILLSWMPTLKL